LIADLSPYGQFVGDPSKGWRSDDTRFVGENGGWDLLRVLRLYALQAYLEAENLPSDELLGKYKVTIYYFNQEGDKIVILTPREACDALTSAHYAHAHFSGGREAKFLATFD
jgi:hypothetical protein